MNSDYKRFCKHGHDMEIVGKTKRHLCKGCRKEENKRYRKFKPFIKRVSNWKCLGINLTKEQYMKMYQNQKGLCAICSQPESKLHKGTLINLSVDHNNQTGEIRGLLCYNCNTRVLKVVEDYFPLIKKATQYLKGNYV